MIIEQTDNGRKGHLSIIHNGSEQGRLTYKWSFGPKIIIKRVEVNPLYSGQGLGEMLIMEAVRFAREKKIAIIPDCPFAKAIFGKQAQIRDVLL